MKNLIFLSVFALVLGACGQDSNQSEDSSDHMHSHENGHDHDHDHDHNGEENEIHFGEVIDEEGALTFSELMTQMEGKDSMNAKVIAKVDDVCQKKGCWMNVYNEEGDASKTMFVQFHDYSFFVPFELGGSVVALEGKAYVDWTSVEELQHYAEDAGQSEEEIAAITEPVEELKFMATGVKIIQ